MPPEAAILIQQMPVAGAVVVVVLSGLKYLRSRDKRDTQRDEFIQNVVDACNETQARNTDALLKNAEAHGACAAALDKVNVTLIRINGGPK